MSTFPRFFTIFLIFFLSSIQIVNAKLKITAIPPKNPNSYVSGNSWSIFVDGMIEKGDAKRLEKIILKNDIPESSNIHLNSKGGSIFEAFKIGKLFRKFNFNTYISKYDGFSPSHKSGQCLSACSLVYLGGEYRYFTKGDLFGVHRFYSSGEAKFSNEQSQIISASIINYLSDLEINPDLFIEMTKAGKDQMLILTLSELLGLGVVNNGRKKPTWVMKSVVNDLYIVGELKAQHGTSKFIMACNSAEKEMFLHIIIDPLGRADEILEMSAHSLYIGHQLVPFSKYSLGKPQVINNLINAFYLFDSQTLDRLENTSNVGFIFQHNYGDGLFLGFDLMDFSGGKELLRGLRATCQK